MIGFVDYIPKPNNKTLVTVILPMRKIAFIGGGMGPLSPELERRQEILRNTASPETRIDYYGGKGSIESREGEYLGSGRFNAIEDEYGLAYHFPSTAKIVVEAEEEGYDAIILSCGGDPGLFAVFEAVNIPVIGPGTTARHICSLISHKFTLLTTGKPRDVNMLLEHENPHGLDRWVSTRKIGMGVQEVRDKPEECFENTLKEAREAMRHEGSDAFTYGCMSMAFLEMEPRLEDELGVPFINPAKVAVRIAEMYIDQGIKHSKISFPEPKNYYFK
jgi:allantoin racemase